MFTASEFRRIARDKLRGHWGRSVLVTFIFSLLCCISSIYNLAKNMGHMDFDTLFAGNYNDFFAGFAAADTETSLFGSLIALVLSIVVLLFSGALEMGLNKYYIDLVAENRQGEVSVIFYRFDIFFKALGLNLFMALFIWLWSLLFIVPGIIAAYRYRLATYLMAENPGLGIREAVNMSKELMAGHKWRLFCLDLSFLGWELLCTLPMLIGFSLVFAFTRSADTVLVPLILLSIPLSAGFFFLHPYEEAAWAIFYRDITAAPSDTEEI